MKIFICIYLVIGVLVAIPRIVDLLKFRHQEGFFKVIVADVIVFAIGTCLWPVCVAIDIKDFLERQL